MGTRRAGNQIWPSSVQTVSAMVREKTEVAAVCDVCRGRQQIDLPALLAKVGPDYSLINRRCRCRITPGCKGWNTFRYLWGVYRGLYDDAKSQRWLLLGEKSRREMTRLIREAGLEREERRARERR